MDEDSDLSTPSYPSPPPAPFSPSLHHPSSPPPPRFGYGYPSFQQEVNNNLNNPPALVLRPGMRGNFRPNSRAPGPGALTGRHLSRSIPVSGFSDFFFSKLLFLFLWLFLRPNLRLLDKSRFSCFQFIFLDSIHIAYSLASLIIFLAFVLLIVFPLHCSCTHEILVFVCLCLLLGDLSLPVLFLFPPMDQLNSTNLFLPCFLSLRKLK